MFLLLTHLATGESCELAEITSKRAVTQGVAEELHISVKTVETHVSAVLRKLQLSNRHELTAWAADRRLL